MALKTLALFESYDFVQIHQHVVQVFFFFSEMHRETLDFHCPHQQPWKRQHGRFFFFFFTAKNNFPIGYVIIAYADIRTLKSLHGYLETQYLVRAINRTRSVSRPSTLEQKP